MAPFSPGLSASVAARVGEAAGLSVKNIDFEQADVKVFGKGRKERICPLGRPSVTALNRMFEGARRVWGDASTTADAPVFRNVHGAWFV